MWPFAWEPEKLRKDPITAVWCFTGESKSWLVQTTIEIRLTTTPRMRDLLRPVAPRKKSRSNENALSDVRLHWVDVDLALYTVGSKATEQCQTNVPSAYGSCNQLVWTTGYQELLPSSSLRVVLTVSDGHQSIGGGPLLAQRG